MTELKPCPFCGGEAELTGFNAPEYWVWCPNCKASTDAHTGMENAIAAWNTRAAYEMDGWFYLPKPKEPIAEVTETTHAWDGTKVRTDVFYQVQEQAVINWAKELDEHIIRRICEVWNARITPKYSEDTPNFAYGNDAVYWHDEYEKLLKAIENIRDATERTCCIEGEIYDEVIREYVTSLSCGHDVYDRSTDFNYCPECGARVV